MAASVRAPIAQADDPVVWRIMIMTETQRETIRFAMRKAIQMLRGFVEAQSPATTQEDRAAIAIDETEIREIGALYNALFPRKRKKAKGRSTAETGRGI